MTQESRLVISVDSRNAKPNVDGLSAAMRALENAGVRVTRSNSDVGSSMEKMAAQSDAAARRMKSGIMAVLGGISTMAIIDAADEWGQYASRIKMATNSTEEYEHVQNRMARSAQTTFRAINETRESFIQMSPVLRDMGLSLDQSIDAVDTFSGLLVVNGANAERGAAAMEALAKSFQRGRVDVQAWMTIYSTTDTVVELLAKSMGKSADEVRRLGIEGKLSAKDMAKALVEGNREVMASVEGMPTTVRDAMQNLKTVFTEYIGWKNEASGATAAFAASLGVLGDNLNSVLAVGLGVGTSLLAAYSAKSTLALIETGKLTKAKIAEAAATKRAAIASEIFARARLAEAQSAVASATGMQRLALVETQLIPARRQLEVATSSLAAANKGLRASMLGLVGGPIGAITLAAGLASSAFFYFQGSSERAKKTLEEMAQPLDDVVGKFKELGRTQMAGKLVEYAEIAEESAKKAEGAFISLLGSIETSDLPQFRTAKDGLFEMIEALNQAEKKGEELDAVINRMGSKLDIPQSVLNKWLVAAANFAEAQKKANDDSEKLAAVKKLYEELGAAAQESASNLTSLNAAMGIEKWDEYLKKLTDARDVIGMNAKQLGAFEAAQAGANSLQQEMAGIVTAQTDAFKKLQSAIDDKDKKAIEAAQNNIRALDIERQKVELLAIKTQALIAATNAFARGEVSGDIASGILQNMLAGFDQAEAAIAVSKEAEAQIKNIFANTASSTKGAAKAAKDYATSIKSLLDTHLPENKALEDLHKNLALLNDARRLGKVSAENYDKALQSINLTYANSLESTKQQIEMERILGDLRLQQSTTQLQFMRELESFGRGDRVRELNADLAKVEDRYRSLIETRRNSAHGLSDSELEKIRESQEKELAIVREYHDKKLAIQGDWVLGAKDALINYADEAANVYQSMGDMVGNAFKGMEDALTSFVTTGKMDFKSLADSIIKDMIRIAIQQSITGPLAGAIGSLFNPLSGVSAGANFSMGSLGGSGGFTPTSPLMFLSSGGYTGDGGRYEPAGIVHKGEGVLNQDEIRALGGESGFNELRRALRGPGHSLGGMAGGPRLPSITSSALPEINVNIHGAQGQPEVSARRNQNGGIDLDIMFKQIERRVAGGIASGQGAVGQAIERRYALTPQLG
ncbi:phage tail tape measure protein [Alcaligenes faecalis subsp. faecalis]|uniref:phage tail tape measure protein n=1 Tax=Alcaligenes faecalis TaxID=511 RepID=UPI001F015CF5|nr:phage tail tape measure protein [Alcaligenes faecalis]MBW4789117.1 phage tail tape measure protein [Alcaligenes faecalis subsp. faecalis]